MKKILIQSEADQIRIAVIEDSNLVDFKLHDSSKPKTKSNIYLGKVFRIEQGLESVFVDYGANRHGFLPFKETLSYQEEKNAESIVVPSDPPLSTGQEIIVQVVKEERGNKGAALTCNIALAGKYLVFMPYGNASGISRRVATDDKQRLRRVIDNLKVPTGGGIILRTAGATKGHTELQRDLDALAYYWSKIQQAAQQHKAPKFLSEESNLYLSVMRDYMSSDSVEAIILNSKEAVDECRDIADLLFENTKHKIEYYGGDRSLFEKYGVDNQLARLFQREIRLPSGGSIVIDPTEALIAIDINSAQSIQGSNIEETALNTNLEAAVEIANQLRFRDIGGLIVVDFIDMKLAKNRKIVVDAVQEQVRSDRARIQVGEMSRFGLLEMSRQHLGSALHDMTPVPCPQCRGVGRLVAISDLVNTILQDVFKLAADNHYPSEMKVQVPLVVFETLSNAKRNQINNFEEKYHLKITLSTDITLGQSDYLIYALDDQNNNKIVRDARTLMKYQRDDNQSALRQPVIQFRNTKPPKSKGLWERFVGLFIITDEEQSTPPLDDNKSTKNTADKKMSNKRQKRTPRVASTVNKQQPNAPRTARQQVARTHDLVKQTTVDNSNTKLSAEHTKKPPTEKFIAKVESVPQTPLVADSKVSSESQKPMRAPNDPRRVTVDQG